MDIWDYSTIDMHSNLPNFPMFGQEINIFLQYFFYHLHCFIIELKLIEIIIFFIFFII